MDRINAIFDIFERTSSVLDLFSYLRNLKARSLERRQGLFPIFVRPVRGMQKSEAAGDLCGEARRYKR